MASLTVSVPAAVSSCCPPDGSLSPSGPSATALDGSTVRVTLASAIAAFVTSSSNTSTLTIPDIGGIAAALSSDSDPYLFKSAGTTFDVVPPSTDGRHSTASVYEPGDRDLRRSRG